MRSKIAQRILEETPLETKIFVRKYAEIIARVHEILQAQGLTQRQLAERMGKNPSELSRWLHGEHNLTLKSLAKLEAELGEEIISVRPRAGAAVALPKQNAVQTLHPTLVSSFQAWIPMLGFSISSPKMPTYIA